jgi:hypothetical protein
VLELPLHPANATMPSKTRARKILIKSRFLSRLN